METVTLSIPGINCHHCIMTIKRESTTVKGVTFVSGDVQAKTATFAVESAAALVELKRVLAEAGYPVAS